MLDKALQLVEAQEVEENLERLGRMHAGYGVKREHFPEMGDALIFTLKKLLTKDWSEATEESWQIVYDRLSSAMIEAMAKEGSFAAGGNTPAPIPTTIGGED